MYVMNKKFAQHIENKYIIVNRGWCWTFAFPRQNWIICVGHWLGEEGRWDEKGEMGLKGQYDKGNKIGCEILKAGGQQI